MVLQILLTLLLVLLNGFFVAAEFALVKVRASQIDLRAQSGDSMARITQGILHNLNAYLSACQLGITVASLLLGWIGESVAEKVITGFLDLVNLTLDPTWMHWVSIGLSFTFITTLHIVIGEQAPKVLALQRSESVSLLVAWPLKIFYFVGRPFIWLLDRLSNLTLGLFGVKALHGEAAHTTEEIRILLDQSKQSGEIQDSEHELIENVFEFNDRMVKQIMVPRTKIVAIDVNSPEDKIFEIVQSEGYSRIPVYEGSIDNIVGILYVKDLLNIVRLNEHIELSRIMRPAYFVPETKKINRLLRQFQRKHMHIAIVSDEFGGVSGIVTIEDIMEELVGEIQDEYDNEVPVVEKVSELEYRVHTSTAIPDANEFLPFPLPEGEDYETVGGLLNMIYGNIPEVGDVAVLDPYEFRVLQRSKRSVELVQLRVTTTQEQNPSFNEENLPAL
ncbi:hemolysins-related protein containing CBS domains [Hymenobacter sp. DG25B]|jgi:CBS domain containing-hemolysin-like protein|uniref:hemolysin family protein n=1 Tax=Hymenobacter sp. DG25B TaxID=1385664 RepID=UPI000540E3B7|nr:hemolysin family protein [Hymenobacter sp. DG25B]AIZ64589.1 hemolysins-related protein containing CBS domains [Hymenobacter sp. DG25B]